MHGTELDERKAFILATVVYEYIVSAEPVGSNTLTQKYHLPVSSATIRNEMAELEAAGYLVQPHTSAGRVPSDAGYRTYVDELMPREALSKEDQRRIRSEVHEASRELDEMIDHTARLLSRLSNNLALVVAPRTDSQTFRHIQLIWLSAQTGVAVIVTSIGVATQNIFELRNDVSPELLTRLSNALNARFSGRLFGELDEQQIRDVCSELNASEDLRGAVLAAFRSARSQEDATVTASGTQNLLDQPEFRDLRKLRSILNIIEEQKTLHDLVATSIDDDDLTVKIGHELGSDEVTECSLVTVPYRMGERAVGVVAVLGPRRMPYGRVMALASSTAQTLGKHLSDVEVK